MFVVQETGDTFRVFRQPEASVKREGSARHATGKGAQKTITRRASLVLYARFALAFARLKNAKKKNSYSASCKNSGTKLVYLLCKEIA